MQVIDFIGQFGFWSWVVFGLILLGLELMLPGVYLVWLGGAALLTGFGTLVFGWGWPMQWAVFGIASVFLVVGWTAYSRQRGVNADGSDSPMLNRRTARFLGREVVLVDAIVEGTGRVKLDDTLWRVSGPDLPAGTLVRITGAEGAVLLVEAVG